MGMKKRALFLLAVMAGALVVASGVAWAATIQCPNRANGSCVGTPDDDAITGTPDPDQIRARAGGDRVAAGSGADLAFGGTGEDRVRGNGGDDEVVFGGEARPLGEAPPTDFPDKSDDVVHGGAGNDRQVIGGFGQGGEDRVYGDDGDDLLLVAQRGSGFDVKVTKEIVDCGPGEDTAYIDRGVDVVDDNCETVINGFPDMASAQGASGTGLFGGGSEQ